MYRKNEFGCLAGMILLSLLLSACKPQPPVEDARNSLSFRVSFDVELAEQPQDGRLLLLLGFRRTRPRLSPMQASTSFSNEDATPDLYFFVLLCSLAWSVYC